MAGKKKIAGAAAGAGSAAAAPAPAAPAAAPVAVTKSEEKGSGTAKKVAPAAPREVTWQMIEQRAYFIFEGRGYAAGDPRADWYEAERQLRAGL